MQGAFFIFFLVKFVNNHSSDSNREHSEKLFNSFSRLLKNIHLPRCAHPSSLRRTVKYASFLMISRALHLHVFDQPVKKHLFNTLLDVLRVQKNILRSRNPEGFRDWMLWFYVFFCFAYNFIKPQG
jgi:hypothetical protein